MSDLATWTELFTWTFGDVTLEPTAVVAILLAGVLAGAVQSALGFGAAFVLIPVLAFVAPQALPGAIIVAIAPLSAAMIVLRRRGVDVRAVGRVTLGRLPGIAAGGALAGALAPRALTITIAAVLLAAVVATAAGLQAPVTRRNEILAGAASGLSGTAAGLGGPPLGLLYRGSSGERLRGTLAAVWLIGSVPALGSLALFGALSVLQLQVGAVLSGLVLLGLAAAAPLVARTSDATVRRGVLVFAGAGAIGAIVRAVGGG